MEEETKKKRPTRHMFFLPSFFTPDTRYLFPVALLALHSYVYYYYILFDKCYIFSLYNTYDIYIYIYTYYYAIYTLLYPFVCDGKIKKKHAHCIQIVYMYTYPPPAPYVSFKYLVTRFLFIFLYFFFSQTSGRNQYYIWREKEWYVYIRTQQYTSSTTKLNALRCLVNVYFCFLRGFPLLFTQRSSISPAEREKFRVRSSPDIEPHKKVKKEEKDCHVSFFLNLCIF